MLIRKNKSVVRRLLFNPVAAFFIVIVLTICTIVIINANPYMNSLNLKGSAATRLHITQLSPTSGTTGYQLDANNMVAVQILKDIDELHPSNVDGSFYSCPGQQGYIYKLDYTNPSVRVTISSDGCQSVMVGNTSFVVSDSLITDLMSATRRPF